ncbi:MAG: hypothetical protein Q9178_001102 [Gyalolechia marmorata]
MLGVFSLDVTPSEPSQGNTTSLRPDVPVRHDQQHNKKASIVDYDDEDEKLNSDLQPVFDQHAQVGRQSSWLYQKVVALLISWDGSCDDLNTKEEVDDLAKTLQETYNYKVRNVRLKNNGNRLPQVQVNKIIADFVYDEDGPSTLLMVYYAGHGTPGHRIGSLELTGERSPTIDDPATVVWNIAEAPLQQTKGDIFEIFDCCYAGDLGRSSGGRGFDTRCFEFLGATSSGATTKSPGPNSFTSGLIWALRVLAKENDRFTTSTLANKIREAPNFPKTQVPILYERNDLASLQRIVIAPLLNGDEALTASPVENKDTTPHPPWGFLELTISLEKKPTKTEIRKFAKDVNTMIQTIELKVRHVKWKGLYRSLSTDGIHSPMASQTPQPADRSRVTVDGTAAKLDNQFSVDEKVWMKNPDSGVFEWLMYVVEKQYDNNKPGWEYKVKTPKNELYKQGAWVSEKELVDAGA